MTDLVLEERSGPTTWERRFEIVERKGLAHPDSICDGVMEEAARTLAREYLETFDQVQHFNLDKALLASGKTSPRFGGGSVDAPMRFIYGDRATMDVSGRRIPVDELVEQTAHRWFAQNLRFVDPHEHVLYQSELGKGSAELVGIYQSEAPGANDTSTGVGFAPLSETEQLVLAAEHHLNDDEIKHRFPETGEDVKVMAVRRDRRLVLTAAVAFVDRFVESETSYFRKKREVEEVLTAHLVDRLDRLDDVTVRVNALDEPGRGEDGTYLTVTGTSAESADSGEVGRGNRLLGFTSATRPASAEAVAGKNPLSHVGKIYNHLAQRAAHRVVSLDAVAEANVFLVSRIGAPLDQPQFTAVELCLERGANLPDVREDVDNALEQTLQETTSFVADWLERRLPESKPC